MVREAAPGLTTAWLVLLVVQGLVPGAIVYTTKWLVDGVNAAVGAGLTAGAIRSALWPALAMGGLLLGQQLLGGVTQYVQSAHGEHVTDRIKARLHAKAVAVDYAFYESSFYHDRLQDAYAQASTRSIGLLQNLGGLLQSTVAFVTITALVASYAWWLPLALFAGAVPGVLVLVRHNRRHRAWWTSTMDARRKAQYLDYVLVLPEYVAEARLYGFGERLAADYQTIRTGLRSGNLRLIRQQTVARLLAGVLTLGGLGGVLVWMARRALQGLATLGDLALFYQAVNQGQGVMRTLLDSIGQAYANALFLEHLFVFLDLDPGLRDPETPTALPERLEEGIALENVSFTYPGASRPSLSGLSLRIPARKITAIVGLNGAGKSTMIKLLCRFYDPDAGTVTMDGIDLRDVRQADLRRAVNVLFQKPVEHQDSARANIALSDASATDADIEAAARASGAHETIERLPRGYDSVLGRLFYEGAELSGGQWQRVALARAYLRPAPVVILDEPTSAMDSWSEMDWLRRFRTLVDGRTAAIVTHRFTVAMQADLIHVVDGGRVSESGTHRELLALGGQYAASWSEQMRNADVAGQATGDGAPAVVSG